MSCRDVIDELPLYVGGDLAAPRAGEVADHVDQCALCRADVAELRVATEAVLARLEREVPAAVLDSFQLRLHQALAAESPAPAAPPEAPVSRLSALLPRPRLAWWPRRPLLAGAASLATVALLAVGMAVFRTARPGSATDPRSPAVAMVDYAAGEDTVVVYRPDDEGTVIVWLFEDDSGLPPALRGR